MKKIFAAAVMVSLFAFGAWAQPPPQGMDRGQMKALDDSKNNLIEQGIEKYIISFDYNSWFEKLTVTNAAGTTQDSQALYYGFGLGLEKNWYHPTWGWGLGGGVLGGSATGGDKSGSLTYFHARVPWWAVRVVPRVFYRWTPRTDFGIDVAAFYKQGRWPAGSTTDVTAVSGSDLISGTFLDMRVRFNTKLEMIQAIGMVYKDESIYWRLGLAYRL